MKRPLRKWLLRLTLVAFLLFVLTCGYVYWDWKSTRNAGEARLAKVMKELDEKEPGWRDVFEERNKRLASAERNSAEKALAVVQSLPREFHNWCNQANPFEEIEPNQLLPDDRIAELKEKLAPHMKEVEKLRELIRTEPNSGFALTLVEPNPLNTLLENRQQFRRVAQLLSFDCLLHISASNADVSIANCRGIVGAGRSLGDDPLLICQLVRLAQYQIAINSLERTLGCGEPKKYLFELQNEILKQSEISFHRFALRGERVSMDQLFEQLDQGNVELGRLESNKPQIDSGISIDRIMWKNYRRYVPDQRAEQLELYNHLIELSSLNDASRGQKMEDVIDQLRTMTGYDRILIHKLTPAFQKIDQAEQRIKSQLLCAVAALASERFRIANGRWPNDLTEIPQSILAAIPHDPFTGDPLKMKRTDTGLVIYSTGKDGIDDGGERLDPKMEPGTDLGFRLFDPAHRRKPAPESPKPPAENP